MIDQSKQVFLEVCTSGAHSLLAPIFSITPVVLFYAPDVHVFFSTHFLALLFLECTFNPPLFVKDILNHGYAIPFKSLPPQAHMKNDRSSLNHSEFVVDANTKLSDR